MLKYFVDKCKSIKADYMNRSPRGKWRFVLNSAIFTQRLTAVAMCDVTFKVWWLTYITGVALFDVFVSLLYTIWYYSEQPLKGILLVSMLGILVPSSMMYVSVFNATHRKELQSLVLFAGEKIYPGFRTECDHKYMRICDRSAIKLLLNAIRTVLMILASNNIVVVFSILSYIMNNELQLLVPVIFPFSDLETTQGVIINSVNQIFLGFIGIAGNIGMEIPTCMLNNTGFLISEAVCYAVDELTEKFKDRTDESKIAIEYCFRNILIQVQDFDRFVLGMHRFFYWRLLLQPILLCFGVSIALFFYLSGVWMSGLGIAMFSFIKLFMPCEGGQEIQLANERLVLKLQEMPWYRMSVKNQLAYAHALHRLQHGAVLRMGPFAPLNFETLSDMTKKMYSFLMMLLRMEN